MFRFLLYFLCFLTISKSSFSQCYEYSSEIRDIEASLNSTVKNLRNIEKLNTLEDSYVYLNKAIDNISDAIVSGNNSKSYAGDCGCNDGVDASRYLSSVSSDLYNDMVRLRKVSNIDSLKKKTSTLRDIINDILNNVSESQNICDD